MNSYVRKLIISVYKFTCQYCNEKKDDDDLEVDHIHPRAHGGENKLANYTVACFHCNRKKRDSVIPESFKSLLIAVAERKAVIIRRKLDEGRKRRYQNLTKPMPRVISRQIEEEDHFVWQQSPPERNLIERFETFTRGRTSITYPACMSKLSIDIFLYLLEVYKKGGEEVKIDLGKMRKVFEISDFDSALENVIGLGFQMLTNCQYGRSVGILSACYLLHSRESEHHLESAEVHFTWSLKFIYDDVIEMLKEAGA